MDSLTTYTTHLKVQKKTPNLKIMVFDRFLGGQFLVGFSFLDNSMDPSRVQKMLMTKLFFHLLLNKFVREWAACVHSQ